MFEVGFRNAAFDKLRRVKVGMRNAARLLTAFDRRFAVFLTSMAPKIFSQAAAEHSRENGVRFKAWRRRAGIRPAFNN